MVRDSASHSSPVRIIRIIARLNVGGPARHVVWLTGGLDKTNYVTLLVAGTVPPGEDDMGYFAAAHGIEPLIIPEMSREISPKDVITIWKLFRLLRRERPDVVHTHTAKAGTAGRLAGLLYRWLTPAMLIGRPRRCRFVHTYHGHVFHSYYGTLKTRIFLMIEKILARLVTDRIIVLSEQQRHEIHEQFGVGRREQFRIIPLGLDLGLFGDWRERRHALRDEWGIGADEVLIGIVGRLTEVKNHELFLRAAALYKEKCGESSAPLPRFVIIGDGHLREKLEKQAHELGLRDETIFTGSRTDPEFFYPALDVVALTSLNEGTPLTLIEAMANERPVVATAVGGVVDLLGKNSGLSKDNDAPYTICERGVLVRPSDARAFSAALAYLVASESLRDEFGDRGRRFVEENYSLERLLNDMTKLYHELS
ncbi:MAG: glycosyltransferase [Pyrinomonadaceae bacterium]|nr:glycosyltransferase [Pyrinomonadaceae bacterium]